MEKMTKEEKQYLDNAAYKRDLEEKTSEAYLDAIKQRKNTERKNKIEKILKDGKEET